MHYSYRIISTIQGIHMTTSQLSPESEQALDLLDIRLGHAMMFLNHISSGEIEVPQAALDQALEAKRALTQYSAQFVAIRSHISQANDPAAYLNQPSVAHLLAQMDGLADVILDEQQTLLEAIDGGLVDIVSKEDLGVSQASSMSMG